MRITRIDVQPWTLDLKAPFVIAARTAYHAHNVRIQIFSEDPALSGLGESAPVGYVTGESVDSVLAAVAQVTPALIGHSTFRLGPLLEIVQTHLADFPAACAGLEMALYDLWARSWNLPLWQHFGARTAALTTDLTIPIVPPDQARALAEEAAAAGFAHFKIKVGDPQGPEADLARVAAIAEAAPQARLRLDANQAFEAESALRFIRAVEATGAALELVEQPVDKADTEALAYVTSHTALPIFADEAACDPQSVLHLIEKNAADGINIKLMKSGLTGALQIITLCRLAGKKLMLGCMLESPVGIAAAAHLAGGTGAFNYLDLDSHHLLAPLPDLKGGFTQTGGTMMLCEEKPGWGISWNNFRSAGD